jgi:hypothetical protein
MSWAAPPQVGLLGGVVQQPLGILVATLPTQTHPVQGLQVGAGPGLPPQQPEGVFTAVHPLHVQPVQGLQLSGFVPQQLGPLVSLAGQPVWPVQVQVQLGQVWVQTGPVIGIPQVLHPAGV